MTSQYFSNLDAKLPPLRKLLKDTAKLLETKTVNKPTKDEWIRRIADLVELTAEFTTAFADRKELIDTESMIVNEVKKTLPTIVKTIVDTVVAETKATKTFADALKKTQKDITGQVGSTMKTAMESALKDNQNDLIEKTMMKQEADQAERQKRCRNVVISDIPESDGNTPNDRKEEDHTLACALLGIEQEHIVSSYRAGPVLGTGTNKERTTPRLLILTLDSPDRAKELHKYGNGNRIIDDETTHWINPDYTSTERKANYEARKARKMRRSKQPGTDKLPTSVN